MTTLGRIPTRNPTSVESYGYDTYICTVCYALKVTLLRILKYTRLSVAQWKHLYSTEELPYFTSVEITVLPDTAGIGCCDLTLVMVTTDDVIVDQSETMT